MCLSTRAVSRMEKLAPLIRTAFSDETRQCRPKFAYRPRFLQLKSIQKAFPRSLSSPGIFIDFCEQIPCLRTIPSVSLSGSVQEAFCDGPVATIQVCFANKQTSGYVVGAHSESFTHCKVCDIILVVSYSLQVKRILLEELHALA